MIQLRSLRSVVLPDPSSVPPAHATATINSAQRRRRIIFLFLEAVTQILYMGWLVKIWPPRGLSFFFLKKG